MRLHHYFLSLLALLLAVACARTPDEEVGPSPTFAAAAPTVTVSPSAQLDVPPTFTPMPTAADGEQATPLAAPSPTSTTAATVTPVPPRDATPTLISMLPPTASPTPPSPTPITPVIDSFEVLAVEELGAGRRITFRWQAAGGSARIFSGTTQREPPWWDVPVSGELTVELATTFYRNPEFTLYVFGGDPDTPSTLPQATATVQVNWPCAHDYFFSPAPRRCPLDAPMPSAAAEQKFEGGSMLWLEIEGAIFVFYADGSWQRFPDTWDDTQPEIDPSLNPPPDRSQPRRGFGLVWRQQPGVRDLLGWALEPEQGFNSRVQYENHEGSPAGAPVYVRRADDGVISVYPFWSAGGTWHQEVR